MKHLTSHKILNLFLEEFKTHVTVLKILSESNRLFVYEVLSILDMKPMFDRKTILLIHLSSFLKVLII